VVTNKLKHNHNPLKLARLYKMGGGILKPQRREASMVTLHCSRAHGTLFFFIGNEREVAFFVN
jgi:hypothetical protein